MLAQSAFIHDNEWRAQWTLFQDDVRFLFDEWIAPATLEDCRDKTVLEGGCGGGQHTNVLASVARSVTAVDLNTTDIARARNQSHSNVQFVEADLGSLDLGRQFDVVLSIGVIHHTDDPDRTFERLYRHCRPGGLMVIWTYSAEGNALVRFLVEPVRKLVLRHLPRRVLVAISFLVTVILYLFVYSVYLIPWCSGLPYYQYFTNFRRLTVWRNVLNVFDKLNAPQTRFTTREKCREWFGPERFAASTISIRRYKDVSWSLVGTKRTVS